MFDCGNCCQDLDLRERFNRNTIASILAGVIFAIGWWIIIDSTCQYPLQADFNKVFYIIGSVATFALILVNSVSNSQIRGDGYSDGCVGQFGARIILFIAFLLAFGSVIGGAWVLFGYYVPYKSDKLYPGIAIFISSKTYDKFWCTTEEGHHQLSCPDETALLTEVTIRKVYRRTQMCEPDVHSDYLIHCQELIDGSLCEGNKTCSIEVSSRNYIQCGDKAYAPTYFFVKYTCTQIYTMCIDAAPIRNTLYGFIVSPAYPHPMADNLKCSINIEAGPSMYIELAPIQIRLQDAIKCRSEYLEIFGYINSLSNNSFSDDTASNKNSKNIWKSYYTWCGAEHSTNNPLPEGRYLISSNSLYMSLQTAVSKKPRYFKIRYKVVPSMARAQYNQEGIAYDLLSEPSIHSVIKSTTVPPTTIVIPAIADNNMRTSNGTITKQTIKKEIIIGIIAGVIALVIAIVVGIGIFLFIKKRRRPTTTSKSTTSPPSTNTGKKNISPTTSTNNAALKPSTKTMDKIPLLEQPPNTTSATATKRKLIPERTVQISDVKNSRFKSSPGATTTTPTTPTATGHTGATGKETSSTSSEAVATSSAPSALKPSLTAADSGIYGADLNDDIQSVTKATVSSVEPSKIYGIDLPDKSDATPPVSVVINPLSEHSPTTPTNTTNPVLSAIVVPNNVIIDALPEEKEVLLTPFVNDKHFDETVKSAYSNLIDATMSENEGTIGGGSIASSASQSRRTSNARQPLLSHETNNIETIPRKPTQFNPLHVILKKDANKYYTTEYI
ncbi:unnamed protein product [Rotaria sp. Silwood1]|nr:unnamed protein product [Rotaria sp. Silwood1]CAF3360195.1 unnamed protein product [Rotaria sp. Silwood1]CAF4704295.1 unnamed protein product [Rotaria sp. Silwood1]CAF4908797.1 unnamed protein product [Rotaria sp. Silwood1]